MGVSPANVKDKFIRKLIFFCGRQNIDILNKYITPEEQEEMYNNMVVIDRENHQVKLENISDRAGYHKLSFYYETIISDLRKKFRVSDDEVKLAIINGESFNQIKENFAIYEVVNSEREAYKESILYDEDNAPGYYRR